MKEHHAVVDKDGELLLCDSRREAQQASRQLHDEQGAASSHRAIVLVEKQDWMAVPLLVRGEIEAALHEYETDRDESGLTHKDYKALRAWLAAVEASLPPVTTEVRDAE